LYFSLATEPVDAGLMITASHNPKEYNGIKICLGQKVIWGDEIQQIKHMFKQGYNIESQKRGSYSEISITQKYIDYLKNKFPHLVGMKLSAVVDCGNGSAGVVMPTLIKKMGWDNVKLLFKEVDGDYPNHEADPTVKQNMRFVKKRLLESDVQVGIGFDGDADRMAAMTKDGQLVSGDILLAVYAQDFLQNYPKETVVFDVNASQGLIDLLTKWEAKPVMSPTGRSIIKEHMDKNNALLAGELSCHFFFSDRYFGYDDGIYAMLRLFEIITKSSKRLKELVSVFPRSCSSPLLRIECADDKKKEVVENVKSLFVSRADVTVTTIDGIRASMDYGWGILRASNTQPVISLRFEAETENGLKKIKKDFFNAMKNNFDKNVLKEQMGL